MTTWFPLLAIGALTGGLLTYLTMNLNDILRQAINDPRD